MVKDHMARKTRLWLRLCRGCQYAKEPQGFKNFNTPGESDEAHERLLDIGDFLPNVAYPTISFDVIPATGRDHFDVGVNLACENCDPVDGRSFRTLKVNIKQ